MFSNLILLHGALGSAIQLAPLKNELEKAFHVYSFNFTGHGGSPLPEEFTTDIFANQLAEFILENELAPANIFGYSMGGYVALRLASDKPGLIAKIMTLGTKLKWDPVIAAKEVKMLDPAVMEEKVPKFVTELKERHAPQDWKAIMTKTAAMMLWLGDGNGLKEADYKKIDVPVLISLGALDQMVTKEESDHGVELIPNGQFHSFEGFKHPIEKIDLNVLTDEIKRFFS